MNRHAPRDCKTMNELRAEIDALDVALIDLLAVRAGYIDRAVDLKRIEGLPARTHARVREVIAKVRASAGERGLDEDLVEQLWRTLIEWSIERESRSLDA
jgi:isochorismate pyruvate lyase